LSVFLNKLTKIKELKLQKLKLPAYWSIKKGTEVYFHCLSKYDKIDIKNQTREKKSQRQTVSYADFYQTVSYDDFYETS